MRYIIPVEIILTMLREPSKPYLEVEAKDIFLLKNELAA